MAKVKIVKQISFEMPDRTGLLAEITAAISKAKVNIAAVCAYGMEKKAYFMMNTASNAKAKKALGPWVSMIEEDDVVAVEMPNKPGELQKVAKKIGDAGINIIYMYGTAATGKSSVCIFKTSDDANAVKAIRKK